VVSSGHHCGRRLPCFNLNFCSCGLRKGSVLSVGYSLRYRVGCAMACVTSGSHVLLSVPTGTISLAENVNTLCESSTNNHLVTAGFWIVTINGQVRGWLFASVYSAAEAEWPWRLPTDLAKPVVPRDAACVCSSLSEDCRPWRGSHSGDLATARPLCTSEARNTGCRFWSKQLIKQVLI